MSDELRGKRRRGLFDALRTRGYRLTPQRQLIVELIEAATGHITPESIYQEVHRRFPNVNRSTVYRTFALLEELGLMTYADLGDGAVRYHHADEAGHFHLICQECGHMQQVDDLSIGEHFARELWERYRFKVDLTHQGITGRCPGCC